MSRKRPRPSELEPFEARNYARLFGAELQAWHDRVRQLREAGDLPPLVDYGDIAPSEIVIHELRAAGLSEEDLVAVREWSAWDATRPTVSYVIPSWNTRRITERCLEAIFAVASLSFEVVLVDQGSVDGTRDLVPFYRNNFGKTAIRGLLFPENRGYAVGANAGARLAIGRNLCFLNSDTIPTRLFDVELHTAIVEGLTAAGAGPMSNRIKGRQKDPTAKYSGGRSLDQYVENIVSKRRGTFEETPKFLSGMCLFVPEAVWYEIGEFDETFSDYGNFEDDDWCRRAVEAGRSLWIARGAFVHHEGAATFTENRVDYHAEIKRAGKAFLQKWGEPLRLAEEGTGRVILDEEGPEDAS